MCRNRCHMSGRMHIYNIYPQMTQHNTTHTHASRILAHCTYLYTRIPHAVHHCTTVALYHCTITDLLPNYTLRMQAHSTLVLVSHRSIWRASTKHLHPRQADHREWLGRLLTAAVRDVQLLSDPPRANMICGMEQFLAVPEAHEPAAAQQPSSSRARLRSVHVLIPVEACLLRQHASCPCARVASANSHTFACERTRLHAGHVLQLLPYDLLVSSC